MKYDCIAKLLLSKYYQDALEMTHPILVSEAVIISEVFLEVTARSCHMEHHLSTQQPFEINDVHDLLIATAATFVVFWKGSSWYDCIPKRLLIHPVCSNHFQASHVYLRSQAELICSTPRANITGPTTQLAGTYVISLGIDHALSHQKNTPISGLSASLHNAT